MLNTDKLIEELRKENLCTYFILPLLKLNKKSFVQGDNFINSYLTKDGLFILVKVAETIFFMNPISYHRQYMAIWKDTKGAEYIQFSIPSYWKEDVKTFIKGKYSQLTIEAKEMIRKHSGLLYMERRIPDNVAITDVRLLALDKSVALRHLWENHYEVSIDEEIELLSISDANGFIDMDILLPCNIQNTLSWDKFIMKAMTK